MARRFIIVFFCLSVALTGCAPRGAITALTGLTTLPEGATVQRVFIATDRTVADNAEDGQLVEQRFGETRYPALNYGHIDISIPPTHVPGQIEWPRNQHPDPAKHFVALSGDRYAQQRGFLRALPRNSRSEVVMFVHGFNVNNAEAVYRLAQIAHDYEADVPVISFSWPSAGDARGYVYDRDSVIFARDDLETLMTGLARDNRRVMIVAHSMGGQLVMETLRQLSISGKGHVIDSVVGVSLISPDIDEDVFLRQAKRIEPFPQPFNIMVSTRDRALTLAALLTGKQERLGSIQDPSRLASLPVDIIDLSDIDGGDRAGHSTAFTAPDAIRLLRRLAGG
ncbi:alpha/beta hydrolase [Antarctobacter jejuensis]|uniref:alpha/beta hydrolase n=1 Tax=Antarctobacter jejuensis TaxID=1439938 RepID=UPI003FD0891D